MEITPTPKNDPTNDSKMTPKMSINIPCSSRSLLVVVVGHY